MIQVNHDLSIRENIFAASSSLPTIEVTYGGVKQNLTGEALESLKEYILMNVASEDFAGVKSNLEVTRVLREMGRDAAYFNGSVLDHACPMTIRRSTGKLIRKPPDVIGIGFAKCGTGSLDFLDCHPSSKNSCWVTLSPAGIVTNKLATYDLLKMAERSDATSAKRSFSSNIFIQDISTLLASLRALCFASLSHFLSKLKWKF